MKDVNIIQKKLFYKEIIFSFLKALLDQKHLMGQIDEKEYALIVNKIDNKMIKLGSFNPEWVKYINF